MEHQSYVSYDASDPRLPYTFSEMMWPLPQQSSEAAGSGGDSGGGEADQDVRPHSHTDFQQHTPADLQNQHQYHQQISPSNGALQTSWGMLHNHQYHQQYQQSYHQPMRPSSLGFMPISQQPASGNACISSGTEMPMMAAYTHSMEQTSPLAYMSEFHHSLMDFPVNPSVHTGAFGHPGPLSTSPNESFLPISPSSSDSDWHVVEHPTFGSFNSDTMHPPAVWNPRHTLVLNSDPNSPEFSQPSPDESLGSGFEDVPFPVASPDMDGKFDPINGRSVDEEVTTKSRSAKRESKTRTSPTGSLTGHASNPSTTNSSSAGSPPPARHKASPSSKVHKPTMKKPSGTTTLKKDPNAPKRTGKRKGPLSQAQREQAGQIRKIRACLRCKCLKKTCDPGTPCEGCKPHHVRNWNVPCTRIDIKDVAYFMKDWKADFERHVTLQFSLANIVGLSDVEHPLWIGHGFSIVFPINAREVKVRDSSCFNVEWVETPNNEVNKYFDMPTARLTAGEEGPSMPILSEYLDRHIDEIFEKFVREQFGGTIVLTELLMIAYRYYTKTKLPVVRKALKFVVAYNLTQHVTFVEGLSEEDTMVGKIDGDFESRFQGKTVAPVMINFQVKVALARVWRDLQKDVLEDLSKLFTGVYGGDKLKNWSTIFVLTSLLLIVWEEMQFDAQYREPNEAVTEKFCKEMEGIPAGVITGLFTAVSQKLPAFNEWDTQSHQAVLNSNSAACDVMTEIRENVMKYDEFLKDRGSCKFDRDDFDCLNGKLTSQLVVRAN